jgi:transcription antitermination factor NusG
MRTSTIIICAVAIGAALALIGCGHKLVAAKGERTVAVYPDEDTWKKLAQMKQQGGMAGMLGGLGENFAAKQVDDKTPVRLISSDTEGSKVEVTDGPFKGLQGFVPRENVD